MAAIEASRTPAHESILNRRCLAADASPIII
jgi:hypothetical protein